MNSYFLNDNDNAYDTAKDEGLLHIRRPRTAAQQQAITLEHIAALEAYIANPTTPQGAAVAQRKIDALRLTLS